MAEQMTVALERLAADLLAAASTQQAVRVRRALVGAAATAPDAIRDSALSSLPQSGHVNEWVADAVTSVIATSTARGAAVTVRTRKTGHDLQSIDAGVLRHPVYGNRSAWRVTKVRPGFFSRPMRTTVTAAATAAMTAEMARTAAALTGG